MKTSSTLIKRQTVTAEVAGELRRRIINGHYAGGDQIRQEALAAELGVSRIPIREALLQLEAEGLVVIHTHRGAVVAQLSADDAFDLFEARLALEPAVIRQAIELSTPETIEHIAASLAAYEKAVSDGAGPETLSALNWAFHIAMCEPAKRPRTLAILLSLYTTTDRYLRLQIDRPGAKTKALRDHRAIFEAYRQRKTTLAVDLLTGHIRDAYEDVMQRVRGHKRAARAPGR